MRVTLLCLGIAALAVSQPAIANDNNQFGTVGHWGIYSMPNSCRLTTEGEIAALTILYGYVNADNSVQLVLSHRDWKSLQAGGPALNISVKYGSQELPGAWISTENLGFRFGPIHFESFLNVVRRGSPLFSLQFF